VNQLCTAGIDQRSGKYIYVCQVAALLGGDIVVPSGLYARLCHAFLLNLLMFHGTFFIELLSFLMNIYNFKLEMHGKA